ncbi:MAG TPA: YggT family protein [Actinobacteria bacterium]|nr:YggT family protein [Actinomycetota bacterium]
MGLVRYLLNLFLLALFAWIVLGYVVVFGRLPWGHPVRKVYDFLSRVFEPILRPIRRVVPPVRIGGAALDLSPLILVFGVYLLLAIL